jgi:hypothetical protein
MSRNSSRFQVWHKVQTHVHDDFLLLDARQANDVGSEHLKSLECTVYSSTIGFFDPRLYDPCNNGIPNCFIDLPETGQWTVTETLRSLML